MARRVYSAEDKALVKHLLEVHEGNVKRTAREADVPVQTVRDWKIAWEREGAPLAVREATPATVERWVGNVKRVRDKAVDRLEQALDDPTTKVNVKDLSMTIGILTDKVRVAEGKPTTRSENVGADALPIEQARELFAGMARGMLEAAERRHHTISSVLDEEDIIDGDWEQAEQRALTAPETE